MKKLHKRLNELEAKLEIEKKKEKIALIEKEAGDGEFWKDTQQSAKKMKELSYLTKLVEEFETINKEVDKGLFESAEKKIARLEFNLYFSSPHDRDGAILSIHSGQGGVEAMDWAEMLYRMYHRYIESKNWKYKIVHKVVGEEAGIKSVTISIPELLAYGYLKGEAGTHRLVRQSPFNADKLRQTSFALVEVLPILEETEEINIKNDDLEWDFFRSSGKGGQNVNKVSSAVRVRHKPTGITVECQQERYQAQNREVALKILRGKLWKIMENQKVKQLKEIKGKFKIASWGNQIRSYILHPYHLVKDLRTCFKTQNTQAVLDGKIDDFITAYLKNNI